MKRKAILAVVLSLLALFAVSSFSPARGDVTPGKIEKVDLPNGSYYLIYVPKCYEPDGKTGVYLILHGAGGTAKGMISAFVYGETGNHNYLEERNCIGVAPKSIGRSWQSGESTPMDALNEVLKNYKVDKKRIHLFGYSAGGFFSGWLGFEKPELFRTICICAAFLAQTNMASVKKHIQKPVYFVCGENDPNAQGARDSYNLLLKWGARYTRIRIVPGQGHNFPFRNEFPLLFRWYAAMDSGYDYASALDEAKKLVKRKIKKAIAKVREIESHPPEDVFWKTLAEIKGMIDKKGEKKLKGILAIYKPRPQKCIEKLKEFEELFEGYPVADKAKEAREKLEAKLAGR